MSMDTQEYWDAIEAELGQPVLGRALAQHISGADLPPKTWGVIYFTSDEFHFHHFPQVAWFDGVMGGRTGKRKSGAAGEEAHWNVRLGVFSGVERGAPRSFVERLLRGPDKILRLPYRVGGVVELEVVNDLDRFSADLGSAIDAFG